MSIKEKREIIFLIGPPCVGKSTYAQQKADTKPFTIVSYDAFIREFQSQITTGATFDNVVKAKSAKAMQMFNEQLQQAVDQGENIIVDMLNEKKKLLEARISIARNSCYINMQ